jgi:hypothetical protein
MTKWVLGRPFRIPVPGLKGVTVLIGSSVHDTVVFIGFPDSTAAGGIKCVGTGFFLNYKGTGFLVTARHVAQNLGESIFTKGCDPFVVRLNRTNDEAALLHIDGLRWYALPDETVDAAVLPLHIWADAGFDVQYVCDEHLYHEEVPQVDVGDPCYTVGLFRFIYGSRRNFPLVHGGTISLLPPVGELIPVWNSRKKITERVEGYLIESGAIDGASGAPVFARATWKLMDIPLHNPKRKGEERHALVGDSTVSLLGLFHGAWFMPPDAVFGEGVAARPSDVVPVGVGIVVPAHKIVETIEMALSKMPKKETPPVNVARTTSAARSDDSTELHPKGRERFNSLLGAAAQKREQED